MRSDDEFHENERPIFETEVDMPTMVRCMFPLLYAYACTKVVQLYRRNRCASVYPRITLACLCMRYSAQHTYSDHLMN